MRFAAAADHGEAPPTTGAAEASVPAVDPAYHEQARQAAERVLARPEFADMHRGPGMFERFNDWFAGLLGGLVDFFDSLPGWLWWIIVIWMVLTLLAILGHFVWVLVQSVGSGGGRQDEDRPRVHPGTFFDVDHLDSEWVQTRADELLRAGDWRAAARHLYVASLLWLDRAGRVRFHQSKTNSDYLRELRDRPSLAERFDRLTRLFEPVAYGGGEADRSLCEQMRTSFEEMRHETAPPASR